MDTAQAPVNKAIDWVINKAVQVVKAAGKLFGIGKEERVAAKPEEDPQKTKKIGEGLKAIHVLERSYQKEGRMSHENAVKIAKEVEDTHPVFKSINVVRGKGTWDYDYVASPGETEQSQIPAEEVRAANYEQALKVRDQPVGVDLPEGYVYYERGEEEPKQKFIRRLKDDDALYQQLGVSKEGKIVFGTGSTRISKSSRVKASDGRIRGRYAGPSPNS